MKKIIAIFSVMLTCFTILPREGMCGDNCRLHTCKVDEDKEELLSQFGQTGNNPNNRLNNSKDLRGELCFHCDAINHEDDCAHNAVVATFSADGTPFVFYCRSDFGTTDDDWELMPVSNLPECSDSPLLRSARGTGVKPYPRLKYKDSDWADVTESKFLYNGSEEADSSKVCTIWECEIHYTASTDRKSCISALVESVCTDSGGTRWTGSECVCDSGNGLDQSSDKKTCICKTAGGYQWIRNPSDSKKCIDPGSACSTSGGDWTGTDCDCSSLGPEKTSDGTQCVDDPFFQPCKDSGGQWDGTECTNCNASRGLTPAPGNKTCKCINSNEEYSPTSGRCVLTEQALCENTGGAWDGTNCDCDISGKNIKKKDGSDPVQCECKSPDYEWNADNTQGCKLSSEAENRKENFEKSKEACEAWGGTWSPETWESPDGADVTKWKCECPNIAGVVQATAVSCKCDTINRYQETAPGKCEPTECKDLEKKCATVSDASYKTLTAHGGQEYCECVCNDKNKVPNYSKNKCEAITNICDLIDGVLRDTNNKAKLDKNGNCICKSTLLPPVRGKCPSGTSSGSASGGGASSGVTVSPQQIAQAKQNVSDVYDDLKSISDGFGRSHWKTASGNFNGARLASDSIAGVVLGTVGGVVTSNVIKKNQVKGGFESLQCTVGGQLVADFGDQFQVGIR